MLGERKRQTRLASSGEAEASAVDEESSAADSPQEPCLATDLTGAFPGVQGIAEVPIVGPAAVPGLGQLDDMLDLDFARAWPLGGFDASPIAIGDSAAEPSLPEMFLASLAMPLEPSALSPTAPSTLPSSSSSALSMSLSLSSSSSPSPLLSSPSLAALLAPSGPGSSVDPASLAAGSSSPPWSEESFPDSYLLPVNELTLLRAFLRIAGRLGCESVWELTANSPFNSGTGPAADELPRTWRPTTSQVLVPHHPVVDLLPWPSVRDRIIGLLAMPDHARPPSARGPLAVVNFAYDMEDGAEGMRIWGGNPYDDESWEVGQVCFERWWFIFDRHVVEQSNRWRRLRGAPPLHFEGGLLPPPDLRVAEL